MEPYTILSIIMFIIISIVLYSFIKYNRDRNDSRRTYYFIRNFKNGPVFIVYGLAFLVFLIGTMEKFWNVNPDAFYNVFLAIINSLLITIDSVVFKFQLDGISNLMENDIIYRILVFLTIIMTSFSSILFITSFFSKNIYNNARVKKALSQNKLTVIVGFNDQNFKLYDKEENIILIDCIEIDEKDSKVRKSKFDAVKEDLHLLDIPFVVFNDYNEIYDYLKKLNNKHYKDLRVIINTSDEKNNVFLINEIFKNDLEDKPILSIDELNKLNYYVFGSTPYKSIYTNLLEKSRGIIHFVNLNKMIADEFEYKYPLTYFMDDAFLDYSTGTLKDDANVNVFMLGFGKTSKELLVNSICNNQFIINNKNESNNDINNTEKHKPVNYYVFEKDKNSLYEKNLNHTLFRFENEYLKKYNENEYYDEVSIPAKITIEENVQVESKNFYNYIEDIIENGKTFNYIIVSCGDDLYNIDVANKLRQKSQEWDVNEKTKVYIFVKIKDDYLASMIVNDPKNSSTIIPFAMEEEVLCLENIVNLNIENLALNRHIKYTESSFSSKTDEDILKKLNEIINAYNDFIIPSDKAKKIEAIAIYNWFYKWNQNQRDSNFYAALNIRFKMNLLGFDLSDYNDKLYNEYSNEFNKLYGLNKKYDLKSMNTKGIRRNLAIQEHYRWNAYMVCNGFIPAKKSVIDEKYPDHKDYLADKRLHANITSIKGLEEYIIHITKLKDKNVFKNIDVNNRNKILELSLNEDVFCYDFEFMDTIISLLPKLNLGIDKKKNNK